MRVSPNAMTMLGLLVSITIPFVAAYGIATQATALLWLATLLIPVAGLIDSLDGAVAVMTGRTSRFGYVLDSVCDRISEIAITATLIIVGGQWVPVMAAILLGFLLEYERSRVRAIEGDWDAPLTLAERPTRLIIVGVFLGLATLAPFGIAAATWATVGAVVAALVAAIGVAQLSHTSYRHLR
jgi:CDP-diacylglycerol--glycerol-3-phosphate 3-phosphatidyltransferase